MGLNDVGFIGMIALFWLVLTVLLTSFANDPVIGELSSNNTLDTSIDINISEATSSTDLENKPYSGIGMFFRMFTFRIPYLHIALNLIISVINYFLLGMFALLIYRQFRSGGG